MRRSSNWSAQFLVLGLCTCNAIGARDQQQDVVHAIDAAELSRETNLSWYRVTEYYTIRNSHFSRPAEATVETTYKRGQGKTYKVLSRSGPLLLQNRVLDRLLQEEGDMSRGNQAVLTSANYTMRLIARESVGGILCDIMDLNPKRRSPYLVKGRLWVNATDMTVVRVEGKPPVSASFFSGRPQIMREYKRIGGFALAERSHAVSTSFLFGQSAVDIEYRDYHVITSAR